MTTRSDKAHKAADSEAQAHTDFREEMSYSDYLHLDSILECQTPLSDSHDETLFIILHQTSELWLKLAIHELKAAIEAIRLDDLEPSFKMLARVSRIQAQLIQSWDVLSTLTPADYLAFRDKLGRSSGFQSHQYRSVEFLLGAKNQKMMEPHRHRPDLYAPLDKLLHSPSLYDESIRLLARRGFELPQECVNRDWSTAYKSSAQVKEAWMEIYQDVGKYWDLYALAEKLVDLEDWFQQWRFRHMQTVERIIGHKRGTGGTAGVAYLKKMVGMRFFPELWEVRTDF
jgi:tryptophan 2,3-dioxygenase